MQHSFEVIRDVSLVSTSAVVMQELQDMRAQVNAIHHAPQYARRRGAEGADDFNISLTVAGTSTAKRWGM
eukprot:1157839-Pelagomonas_calceolata.AAC.7